MFGSCQSNGVYGGGVSGAYSELRPMVTALTAAAFTEGSEARPPLTARESR